MAAQMLYLKDLPPNVREIVCRVLAEDRAWEVLVRKLFDMQINIITIEKLESEASPADKLLDILMMYKFKDGFLKIATFYKISATLKLHKLMCCLAPYVKRDIIENVEDAMKQSSSKASENNFSQNNLKPNSNIVYLHQLPEMKKIKLCEALNRNDEWRFLMAKFEDAGFKLDHIRLCEMNCPNNPSSELFKLLADRNFKISLLYAALASMNIPEAMNLLQCYVSENLVRDVEPYSFRKKQGIQFSPVNNIPCVMNEEACDDSIYGTHSRGKREVERGVDSRGSVSGISYGELSDMTNQWSQENCLGSNGRGNFYLGLLDGQEVAVKRLLLKDEKRKVLEELHQLECFAANGPKNVLKMLMLIEGDGDNNPCIIYPFKKKKSLYDHLLNEHSSPNDSLTSRWRQKQVIALGVTEALIYLQKCLKRTVIVKSSDIILDDTMEPLVADVCLPSILDGNRSKYLSMYMPRKEQEIETFCIGTILLELTIGDPADRFVKHPEEFKDIKEIRMGKKICKEFKGTWKTFILECLTLENNIMSLISLQKELEMLKDIPVEVFKG